MPRGGLDGDVVIEVAGFGSDSGPNNAINHLDVDSLGLDRRDVVRFSYAGGRVATADDLADDLAAIDVSAYDSSDSQRDLDTSSARLAALIDMVMAARPQAHLHLVAHSQGGIVTVLALGKVIDRSRLDVVTIGSPHQGDTLATASDLWSRSAVREAALDGADRLLAGFGMEHDSPAARQMSKASDLMAHYRLPDDVRLTSIGAARDLIVPGLDTALPGARNVLLAGPSNPVTAHSALVADPATTLEIARALHGQAPTCQSVGTALIAAVTGDVSRSAQDALALAGLVGFPAPGVVG